MKSITFDLKLRISGYVVFFSILILIVIMIFKMNTYPNSLEKRLGVISFVIKKKGIYNFKIKSDTTLYGKGFYINDDIISRLLYKQFLTPFDLNHIIELNDTISFFIRKNTYFEYELLNEDNNHFPSLISDGIMIRRIRNSEIKQCEILTVNHKQITNAQSDYIFSSQAKIIINIIYLLCIFLAIILIFKWILKVTDKMNLKVENERKQITEKNLYNLLSFEKQLSCYTLDDFNYIPNNKIQDITNMADLYWITNSDVKKAERIYKKILSQYPKNVNTLTMYSEFLFSQKRFTEADNLTEKAVELDPNVALLAAKNYKSINQKGKEKYWKRKYKSLSSA